MSHNFKNGKWSDPAVPKRDWYFVHGYDRGQDNLEFCDMCESASVRYVHVMRHDDYSEALEVGCICAGHMEQDYAGAKRREADVRNRSARRAKWLTRSWSLSRKGNPTLRVQGYFVTVFKRGLRWGWLIVRRANDQKWFSDELYAEVNAAKLATFDVLERIREQCETEDSEDEDDDFGFEGMKDPFGEGVEDRFTDAMCDLSPDMDRTHAWIVAPQGLITEPVGFFWTGSPDEGVRVLLGENLEALRAEIAESDEMGGVTVTEGVEGLAMTDPEWDGEPTMTCGNPQCGKVHDVHLNVAEDLFQQAKQRAATN